MGQTTVIDEKCKGLIKFIILLIFFSVIRKIVFRIHYVCFLHERCNEGIFNVLALSRNYFY